MYIYAEIIFWDDLLMVIYVNIFEHCYDSNYTSNVFFRS